jgi:putative heme-binding domain-containing protein
MRILWMLAWASSASLFCARAQEHSYTPADIEEGGRWYRRSCVGCHGGYGTSVAGIDLGRGKFRRALSDEDLVKVILEGVPGTGMPATQMPPTRVPALVTYLRTMHTTSGRTSVAAARGDVRRGKLIFENKGACLGCHRVGQQGGRSGPSLNDAGHLLRAIEIEIALLDPDEQYPSGTRPVRVEKKGGAVVTGLLVNQDSFSVQMVDQEGMLRSLERSEVQSVTVAKSWMPSYRGKLDGQELADLIAYVGSLRGAQ